MSLENLESKETLIANFFTWLFDDYRIIDKNVDLQKEIDLTLAPYYIDANIYYPKQIANFFNTHAMKRLGRISQLDLAINDFPNTYHNRLEHSKGVYYKKLEEMLYNFQKKSWRKTIENHELKLYLLADLIKMAGHDIGHLPLSHALEDQILSRRGIHEDIGKRIMLEDPEIYLILTSISPHLPNILKELYEKNILNFNQHDESNYDVDRLDYISRDNFYIGSPVHLPYSNYETIPVIINNSGTPEQNEDGSIKTSSTSSSYIDVYEYSSLKNIEELLELREKGYLNLYFSTNVRIYENCIGTFFNTFLSTDSNCGKNLRNFLNTLKNSNIDDLDLNLFLEWDEIKFYSEILDIAEHHDNPQIRQLATMTIPNMKAFLTMLYSHLNVYNKGQNYSPDDIEFLKKIKKLIQGNDQLSKNLKNENFLRDNILIYSPDKSIPQIHNDFTKSGLINKRTLLVKAYNPKHPIYIKSDDGKIYELSNHPSRKCDWEKRITPLNYQYSYIPILKLNGLSDEQINDLRNFCNNSLHSDNSNETEQNINTKFSINMQPLQVGHEIEDCFLEI